MNVLALDDLEKVSELVFRSQPAQVHQAVLTNGGALLTDTFHNKITYQSTSGALLHHAIDGHTNDVNHVNSLFLRKGGVVAMLHNLGAGGSELLDLDFDATAGFSVRQRRRLPDTRCHNVFLDGGHCFYNASDTGDFVVHDLALDHEHHRAPFDGHAKGMSVTADHIVIGVSEVASQADRGRSSSSLVFLDRRTFHVIKQIPLVETKTANPIGNVNEIRCLSEPDYSEGSPEVPPMVIRRAKPLASRISASLRRWLRRR